jgi:hypothetical protein
VKAAEADLLRRLLEFRVEVLQLVFRLDRDPLLQDLKGDSLVRRSQGHDLVDALVGGLRLPGRRADRNPPVLADPVVAPLHRLPHDQPTH